MLEQVAVTCGFEARCLEVVMGDSKGSLEVKVKLGEQLESSVF